MELTVTFKLIYYIFSYNKAVYIFNTFIGNASYSSQKSLMHLFMKISRAQPKQHKT